MSEIQSDESSCDETDDDSSSLDQLLLNSEEFGRYRIGRLLGAGAMGSVLLSHDTILEREVALKIPVLKGKDREKSEQRFFREARAAAAIHHPNICPIYDVGTINETFYISMGYIEGKTLAHLIDESGPFPQKEAADLVRRIALALHEAHQKGVVHRDLKPNNIMIDRRGEPIVMDFGLAYSYESEDNARLTRDGMTVGTPGYMSPEQVCGERELGPPSDIFSLGILLYELVCGKRPFKGKSMILMGHIAHGRPIDPKEFREDLEPDLEAIIRHALEKKPKDRFSSMQEFADTLDDFIHSRPCLPGLNSSATNPEQVASRDLNDTVREQRSLEVSAISGAQRTWSGRNIALIAGACAVGVLIGGIAFSFFSDKEPEPSSQQDSSLASKTDSSGSQGDPPAAGSQDYFYFEGRRIPLRGFDPAELFRENDENSDGILSPWEFPKPIVEMADTNADGFTEEDEFVETYEQLGDELMLSYSKGGPHGPRGHGPHRGPGPGGPPSRRMGPPPRRPGENGRFEEGPPRRPGEGEPFPRREDENRALEGLPPRADAPPPE